jgi:2,4-dienoyl-CoA reductase-like NADH-dependent reductase (Old Yellow Enzyme family)
MSIGPQVSDDVINYHVARGEGGVGLTILEATAVHPSSVLGMAGWNDAIIEGYRKIVDAVRPTGMRLFQQLWHGGHIYSPPDGSAPRGVSRIPGVVSGVPPVPIRTDEIPTFIEAFASAARRSVSAGIEGIELAASHGYLFHQFMSAATNTRTDRYGGSLENRMRFLVETLIAVREAIGPERALGIRVGAGVVPGDLSEAELALVAKKLVSDGLIDYLNVSMGDYYALADVMGAMERPAGYQLESSAQITAAAMGVPRLVTGRFRTLEEAEQVLKEGTADLVSMVRAHIADPLLVVKTRNGNPEQVRPCIGCNQGCLGRTSGMDGRLGCVVNPAIGREGTLSESRIGTTTNPKQVMVIGGGPAGLEAARTARLRGHQVMLHEAADKLGGSLNLARLAPRMQGMDDILDWLQAEVARLGVVVNTSSYLDADDIAARAPDVVIIATGAQANFDGHLISAPGELVEGIDLPHVLSSVDLLSRPGRNLGQHALVYDEVGQYEAVAVVEYLLERGLNVTVATRFASFSPLAELALRVDPALKRFGKIGPTFRVVPRSQLVSVASGTAVLRSAGAGGDDTVPADTVVMVTYKIPIDDLADLIRGKVDDVRVVGDAHSGRDLQVAIREGHLAGRSID